MTIDLKDIRITDLATELTRRSDKGSGMRHMFLRLSASPPADWIALFDHERSFPRHSMWRRAWVEQDCIVVDCVPDEIEQYHLKDLKEDVSNANLKYRIHLKRVADERERMRAREEEEAAELEALKGKLDFDD